MPAGTYHVIAADGSVEATEDFRCAPGPMGWRYFSEVDTSEPVPHHETIDVAVDASWRPVRLRVDSGDHQLLLEADGDRLAGWRDGEPIETPWHPEMHLDYLSPAFNAITCRRLTATTEIEVVFVDPYTLEPHVVRQRYEFHGDEETETPVGTFAAARWTYTALEDDGSSGQEPGWTSELWCAQDVVVRYDRLFRLERYEAGASGPRPV
jgi:hypothetical protein